MTDTRPHHTGLLHEGEVRSALASARGFVRRHHSDEVPLTKSAVHQYLVESFPDLTDDDLVWILDEVAHRFG